MHQLGNKTATSLPHGGLVAVLDFVVATADSGSGLGVVLSFIVGFFGVFATIFGVWLTYKGRKRELDFQATKTSLEERQQAVEERSVSYKELEEAVPGLGDLVKLYQASAQESLLEATGLRKELGELRETSQARQLADHLRIIELEGQVRALAGELVAVRKHNERLEEEVRELKGRK